MGVPEDTLPPIPSGLSLTETNEEVITASFESQYQAMKKKDRKRKKRENEKRSKKRLMLQNQGLSQQLQQPQRYHVVAYHWIDADAGADSG